MKKISKYKIYLLISIHKMNNQSETDEEWQNILFIRGQVGTGIPTIGITLYDGEEYVSINEDEDVSNLIEVDDINGCRDGA